MLQKLWTLPAKDASIFYTLYLSSDIDGGHTFPSIQMLKSRRDVWETSVVCPATLILSFPYCSALSSSPINSLRTDQYTYVNCCLFPPLQKRCMEVQHLPCNTIYRLNFVFSISGLFSQE